MNTTKAEQIQREILELTTKTEQVQSEIVELTNKAEQIQNEILERTNKINALQNDLESIKKEDSQGEAIDFQTMMDWANEYFVQKENIWELTNDLEGGVSVEDVCEVQLSLSGTEIEVEKEWVNTRNIVERVMNAVHNDFKNWMKVAIDNHTGNTDNK